MPARDDDMEVSSTGGDFIVPVDDRVLSLDDVMQRIERRYDGIRAVTSPGDHQVLLGGHNGGGMGMFALVQCYHTYENHYRPDKPPYGPEFPTTVSTGTGGVRGVRQAIEGFTTECPRTKGDARVIIQVNMIVWKRTPGRSGLPFIAFEYRAAGDEWREIEVRGEKLCIESIQ